MLSTEIRGLYYRVSDPNWVDPVDPSFAAMPPGKRWNPPGLPAGIGLAATSSRAGTPGEPSCAVAKVRAVRHRSGNVAAAVRAARAAPGMPMAAAAAASGCPAPELRDRLLLMGWRGRCDAAIASMVGRAHKDNTLARRLIHDRRCPPPIWRGEAPERRLWATGRSGTAAWRAQVAGSNIAPRARIAGTVDEDGPSIAAVGNSRCPPAMLMSVIYDRPELIAARVAAANPACGPHLVLRLATSTDQRLRASVAFNPLVVEHLQLLGRDTDPAVRTAAALNSDMDAVLLEQLSEDADLGVRIAVAGNSACPAGVLDSLARDHDADVRVAVARHEDVSVDASTLLADDDRCDVREAVAGNHKCPRAVLLGLVDDYDRDVRVAVAKNLSCPSDVLDILAEDPEPDVRAVVAEIMG